MRMYTNGAIANRRFWGRYIVHVSFHLKNPDHVFTSRGETKTTVVQTMYVRRGSQLVFLSSGFSPVSLAGI